MLQWFQTQYFIVCFGLGLGPLFTVSPSVCIYSSPLLPSLLVTVKQTHRSKEEEKRNS